jgi:hypothetical protein
MGREGVEGRCVELIEVVVGRDLDDAGKRSGDGSMHDDVPSPPIQRLEHDSARSGPRDGGGPCRVVDGAFEGAGGGTDSTVKDGGGGGGVRYVSRALCHVFCCALGGVDDLSPPCHIVLAH